MPKKKKTTRKKKSNKKKSRQLKLWRYGFLFLLSIASTIALFIGLIYLGAFGSLPNQEELSAISNEEASLVYSSDDRLIGKYFAENRTNISYEEIPDHLKNALIATEDKRFFEHKGFDSRSYLRVFLKSILLRDKSGGGGSTLTQQLVKNLYGRNGYGYFSLPINKIKEIIIASRIEKVYDKEELLLLYLNSVPFGEDVYGVEAAAQRYFNKTTSKLKVEESAVLVGMLKANTWFNPRLNPENSLQRRNLVFSLMEKEDYLSAEEAARLKQLPLKIDYENVNLKAPAGYFVYQVKKKSLEILEEIEDKTGMAYNLEKDGLRIYTTLNMQVQEMATEAVKKQLKAMQPLLDKELENRRYKKQWLKQFPKSEDKDLQSRDIEVMSWDGLETKKMNTLDSLWYYHKMLNAAVLISNPKNGAVISWIGGNNFQYLPFDMVQSHRQIASAFKPILYATALEVGFSPCEYLGNEEKIYPEYDDWEPQNYDHISSSDTTVAFWYALTNSMNLPTVDLYFKVGRDHLLRACDKLKFPDVPGDAPSIALGSLDLSLEEIVRAYAAFANRGRMNELVMIDKITDASGKLLFARKKAPSEEVFSEQSSEMITAILQRAIDEGTGKSIRDRYGIQADLAGKTGTAQNYSDAWFVAYTPDLVLGTWVGASTPDVHFYSANGSGSALALPIVANVIKGIERNPALRREYLSSFMLPYDAYASMQCEPYQEDGIKGFLNRLFADREEADTVKVERWNRKQYNDEEDDKGLKGLFKKLFKKKK